MLGHSSDFIHCTNERIPNSGTRQLEADLTNPCENHILGGQAVRPQLREVHAKCFWVIGLPYQG
jgi:hypothetical protein